MVYWESTDETQPLCVPGSMRVRDIYVYYSEQNRVAFCSFSFIIHPTPLLLLSFQSLQFSSQLLSEFE